MTHLVDNWGARLGLNSCAVCSQSIPKGICCSGCWLELPWIEPSCCARCRLPLRGARLCADCLRRPPGWARCQSLLLYQPPVARWLSALKFHESTLAMRLLRTLAGLLSAQDCDCICPIPTTRRRLRECGLNSASLIAATVARNSKRPVRDLLIRDPHATPQHQKNRRQRQALPRRHFQCDTKLRGQRILLVDDVMTSGSTLRVASKALIAAGAARVDVATLMRTPLD